MLTTQQIDDLPEPIVNIIGATEREIINDMARRIAKTGTATSTAQWQASRLEMLGATQDHVMQQLRKALDMSERQLIELFDKAAERTLASDNKIYQAAGYKPRPLSRCRKIFTCSKLYKRESGKL